MPAVLMPSGFSPSGFSMAISGECNVPADAIDALLKVPITADAALDAISYDDSPLLTPK